MNKNFKNLFIPQQLKQLLAEKVYQTKGKRDFTKLTSKYHYTLHFAYFTKSFFSDRYHQKGISISTETLKNLFGNKRDGSEILSNLQEWGILSIEKNYSEGKARTYKLTPTFENLKVSLIKVFKGEAAFIEKLIKRGFNSSEVIDLEKAEVSTLNNKVSISKAGIEWIGNKYPALKPQLANYSSNKAIEIPEDLEIEPKDLVLLSFLTKDFFCIRPDKESRIYTNFTSLKREYRGFIQLNGNSLIVTDLVNSQILFSVPVILNQLKKMNRRGIFIAPKDYIQYKTISQKGKVYEEVAEKAGLTDILKQDRKGFKERFFGEIFFSNVSNRKSIIAKAFADLFPNVFKAINQIKVDNHYSQFAINCQRSESNVMLDRVYKKLINKRITALILHDAIYASNYKDAAILQGLIDKELKKKYNIKVTTTTDKVDVASIPPFDFEDKTENENKIWIKENTGLDINNTVIVFPTFKLYPDSLKVRYNNSSKTYKYSKKKVLNLIKESMQLKY